MICDKLNAKKYFDINILWFIKKCHNKSKFIPDVSVDGSPCKPLSLRSFWNKYHIVPFISGAMAMICLGLCISETFTKREETGQNDGIINDLKRENTENIHNLEREHDNKINDLMLKHNGEMQKLGIEQLRKELKAGATPQESLQHEGDLKDFIKKQIETALKQTEKEK
ncbi:MAG: hypothetical protein KAQ89_05415 [Planctomycetes bacterium]|nr:hypothetical protein [Planctomycetota bacterium]